MDELFIDDIDVKNIKLGDLRKNIAIVPQEAFLFTSSISENLSFGNQVIKGLMQKSATKAGLIDDINNFLKSLKQLLAKRYYTKWWTKAKNSTW